MARIAGINIPMNKHVWVGLTLIYGVGVARSRAACEGAGVNPTTKVKDLTESEVNAIRSLIAKFAVEGDLRRAVCRREGRYRRAGTRREERRGACWRPGSWPRIRCSGPEQLRAEDHQHC